MSVKVALVYAGLAALVAAIMQVLQIASNVSLNPITDINTWGASALSGIVSAAAAAALPWIKAIVPAPPKQD